MRGPPPPRDDLPPPPRSRDHPPTGRARQRGSARPPRPHSRAHSTLAADPGHPPRGRAAGGGRAPNPRRPSQRREAPPSWGRPPASPTARNAGSQERTLWGWCWVPTPTPPAPGKHGQRGLAARPRDGRPGEGERLTPDAPHNGERSPPPRDDLPPLPRRAPLRWARTPKGQCRAPMPAHPRPQRLGSGPRPPAPRTGSRGRTST